MTEIGEYLVGAYLEKEGCFVVYNRPLYPTQGEIDVIGINGHHAFFCEVATHTYGFRYKNRVTKTVAKFDRSILYSRTHFKDYDPTFMFWSPITNPGARMDLEKIKTEVKARHDIEIKIITGKTYYEKMLELKKIAYDTGYAFANPVMRLFQIEENLNAHVKLLEKQEKKARIS
jgi:Holliday junction resolvase-like predicted endonuclease